VADPVSSIFLIKLSSQFDTFFCFVFEAKQKILGRTSSRFSFHYILSIRCDTEGIGNTASNSSIVECVFVAPERVYRAVSSGSSIPAYWGGGGGHKNTESKAIQ
jgi:hypothetical protein